MVLNSYRWKDSVVRPETPNVFLSQLPEDIFGRDGVSFYPRKAFIGPRVEPKVHGYIHTSVGIQLSRIYKVEPTGRYK